MSADPIETRLLAALEKGWIPNKGPQLAAYNSEADIVFYGGAAGGGKTDLLLGLAHTSHRQSIIFRRENVQLMAIEQRSRVMFGHLGTYAADEGLWRLRDGRLIELGGVQLERDWMKYQGRPHDLIGFDEIAHFSESQFRTLMGWLRTDTAGQRVRVVAAGNPPTDAEGEWVIKFWAPWLDERHPNPAAPGELRWFAQVGADEIEVESGEPFDHDGRTIEPQSRTFIRAHLEDNPVLMATGYAKTLGNLPEAMRRRMQDGDFSGGHQDHEWQIIPTSWVVRAQERWTPTPPCPIDALGVDIARGGGDRTVLTPRHGAWFGEQGVHPGAATPDGQTVVRLVLAALGGAKARVNIDVVGVGYAVKDVATMSGLKVNALNGAGSAMGLKDEETGLGYYNLRAFWWWALRCALDPDSGEELALPPTRELRIDLTAPRWKHTARGILVESKEDLIKRIKRSPDLGDSAVYANAMPPALNSQGLLDLMAREITGAAEVELPKIYYAPGSIEWQREQTITMEATNG
jgi:hypothetical protein